MSISTKSNKTATPLTVQPGSPHWITPDHGLASRGQGYDFHDPVSLQTADLKNGTGGYDSGNAITQHGTVEFELGLLNVHHGTVFDLNITRKHGSQGKFDFWITWDPISTGLIGDIRSDVEHGFDISTIDLDLVTLNPSVSADPNNINRFRISLTDGEVKKTIKAIAAYRTNVRDFAPVKLQKPYTYWTKERFNVYAGRDENAIMKQNQPWKSDPSFEIGCESSNSGYVPFKYAHRNIKLVDDAAFLEPTSNAYKYRPEVQQHWTYYTILSLPVPEFFIDPTLVGSPAVPGKEAWKNDFTFYNHENLVYTVGNTQDVVAITRVYVHSQGGTGGRRTGPAALDVLPCCKNGTGDCIHDAKSSWFNRDIPWLGGTATEQMSPDTIMGVNMHCPGLNDEWLKNFEFSYSPNNIFKSGYKSVKEFAFGADSSDMWNHDHAGWLNEPAGSMMFLGAPVDDIKIDSGFNMIFNWIGTAKGSTLANQNAKVCIDETTVWNLSGIGRARLDRVPYLGNASWIAKTGNEKGWAPFDNYNGRAGTGNIDHPFGDDTLVGRMVEWYETRKAPVERWAYHENTACGQPGMGENGTSNTLYDLTELTHDVSTYEKNNKLKGYYKCCTDHNDKTIKLHLSKVNVDDQIDLGEILAQTTFINKSPIYSVPNHALYDNTVNAYHGMPVGNVYEDFQAWDEPPSGKSLTEQLFTSLGADSKSPVQFLSLSAGKLVGGKNPGNGIPPSKPKSAPILRASSKTILETETFGTTVQYKIEFANVGGDDSKLTFEHKPDDGFRSTTGTPYGLRNTTGPTASGDKLDSWSWTFDGNPRLISGTTKGVHLSAGERVTVNYELTVDSMNPDGYNIWHGYQFDKGVLYGGVVNDKTTFRIVI